MALRDWQAALGVLVEARTAGRPLGGGLDPAALDLTDAERAWLAAVPASRGFALTSLVPRWWRETRVRRSARLTLGALAALGDRDGNGNIDAIATAHLADYLRAVPGFTLFFVPEGLAFLDHVLALAVHPLVDAVARFERAMWRARLGDPAHTAIAFPAPPALVFAALLEATPLPALTGELHDVVVGPDIPGLWRLVQAGAAAAGQ